MKTKLLKKRRAEFIRSSFSGSLKASPISDMPAVVPASEAGPAKITVVENSFRDANVRIAGHARLPGWSYWLAWLILLGLLLIQPPLKLTYFPNNLRSALEDGNPYHGFYEPERLPTNGTPYVWTEDRPYVLLDYHTNQPFRLTFMLGNNSVVGGPAQPVQVLINSRLAGELQIDRANPDFQKVELEINPVALGIKKGEQLKLMLVAQPFQPANDQRMLGVALQSIELDKTLAWQPVAEKYGLIFGLLSGWLILIGCLNWWEGRRRPGRFILTGMLAVLHVAGAALSLWLLGLLWQAGPVDWGAYLIWVCGALYWLSYCSYQVLKLASRLPTLATAQFAKVWEIDLAPVRARAIATQAAVIDANTGLALASPLSSDGKSSQSQKTWRELQRSGIVSMWLGWRLALIVVPLLAFLFFLPNDPTPLRPFSPNLWMERLVWAWSRWDGVRYMEIAQNGYNSELVSFYPLYPLAMKGMAFILSGGNQSFALFAVAGLFISLIASLVSLILLYRLTLYEVRLNFSKNYGQPELQPSYYQIYGHGPDYQTSSSYATAQAVLKKEARAEALARKSALYLLVFPCAFFLAGLFTESLFLALGLGAFYLARQRRWALGLFLAGLALLTKNQGMLIVAALAIEYLHQAGWNPRRLNWRILPYFGLPVLSLLAWLGYNQLAFGNPWQFMHAAQEYWGHTSFTLPWQPLWDATTTFFAPKPESGLWLPAGKSGPLFFELPLVLAFVVIGFIGIWACWRGWLRPAYLLFFWGCLLQPLAYPVPENELISMPRYLLIAFPAYFILAHLGQRSRAFHYFYITASLLVGSLLLTRFALWYWVA